MTRMQAGTCEPATSNTSVPCLWRGYFPLTPALCLGERENHSPLWFQIGSLPMNRPTPGPSPEGNCWSGHDVRLPSSEGLGWVHGPNACAKAKGGFP